MTFWTYIAGFICLLVAFYVTSTVKEVKLGANSSKLVAVICGAVGYYYVSSIFPFTQIGSPALKFLEWLLPALLVFLAPLYCSYQIYNNREQELKDLVKQTPRLLLVIGLFAGSRLLFSL